MTKTGLYKLFPTLKRGEKAVISFTGGVDSTLLAEVCIDKYGMDRVIFMLMSYGDTQNFRKDPAKLARVKKDFYNAIERLGVIHHCELTDDDVSPYKSPAKLVRKKVVNTFGCEPGPVFGGWSVIQHEFVQLLQDCNYEFDGMTKEQIIDFINTNEESYPNVVEHLENFGGDMYFIHHVDGFETVRRTFKATTRPFASLQSWEVYDLYKKLNIVDKLADTVSCNRGEIEPGQHCGVCKNCIERKSNFEKAGIEDPTTYLK